MRQECGSTRQEEDDAGILTPKRKGYVKAKGGYSMLAIFQCYACRDYFHRQMEDLEISARQDLGQIPDGCVDSVELGESLCDVCADADLSHAWADYYAEVIEGTE